MSFCQVLPPVSRSFQWPAPWKIDSHSVQPDAFRQISSLLCGMGVQGALWQDGNQAARPKPRVAWPKKRSATSRDDVDMSMCSEAPSRGSVPRPDVAMSFDEPSRGSVPTGGVDFARGSSVPATAGATPVAAVQVKRGQVVIRSVAQYQKMTNCDVLVGLALTQRRIFTETEEDGRSEAIQSQVMDFVAQNTLTNVKSMIFGLLAQKPRSCVRVVIQSHHGKHRSVAMAEILGKHCESFAEVIVWHMAIPRWDANYPAPPGDDRPSPEHRIVLRPEMCN